MSGHFKNPEWERSELDRWLLRLIDVDREEGVEWESEKAKLAERYGLSVRTVERRLKQLRARISRFHQVSTELEWV